MPKVGWDSISVHEDTLKLWETTFELNKQELKLRGITSFSGFVNSVMYGIMQEPKLMIQAIIIGNKKALENFKHAKH